MNDMLKKLREKAKIGIRGTLYRKWDDSLGERVVHYHRIFWPDGRANQRKRGRMIKRLTTDAMR